MTQEALKLARQLLWRYRHEIPIGHQPYMICHQVDEAFERIDEALAQPEQIPPSAYSNTHQPEQEPVKYSDYEPDGVHHNKPPQRTWVGLTDEEYAELAEEFGPFPINQIEAKLKEKNT